MSIHFKFKSAKDFDSIECEGPYMSQHEVKIEIVKQKKLDKVKTHVVLM